MGNVTKSQHYVWRKYLASWTDNKDVTKGKIQVFRKVTRGTQEPYEERELTKIGCENYYYDITGFDSKTVDVFRQLLSYIQRDNLVKIYINAAILPDANTQKDFIEKFVMCEVEDIESYHDFFAKIINKDLTFYEDSGQQKILDNMRKALIKSILEQTAITQEELSQTVTNFINQDWDSPDLKYSFHEFFCMQYYRTPTVRNELFDGIRTVKKHHPELEFIDEDFYVTMLSIYYSMQMALDLTQNYDTSMWVYENKTNIPFITGDCPIVLLNNEDSSNEMLIYHYPISPQYAAEIIVCNKNGRFSQFKKNAVFEIDSNLVSIINNINYKLAKNCYNEIYSNDRDVLHSLSAKLDNSEKKTFSDDSSTVKE